MHRSLRALFAGLLVLVLAVPAAAADRALVVFPFALAPSITDISGSDMTDRIAAEISALGGVRVIKGSTSAKRADYRAEARAVGADLYFTGSVVAVLSSSYSAILQLVTSRGGTVIWSATMNFRNVADIKGEGARIRDEVLRGATPRPYVETPSPAPPASPTPLPVATSKPRAPASPASSAAPLPLAAPLPVPVSTPSTP